MQYIVMLGLLGVLTMATPSLAGGGGGEVTEEVNESGENGTEGEDVNTGEESSNGDYDYTNDYGNNTDYTDSYNSNYDYDSGSSQSSGSSQCNGACIYGNIKVTEQDTEVRAGIVIPLENPNNQLQKARAEQLRNRDRRTIIQDIVQACSQGDVFAVQLYCNEYKALGGDIPASLSLPQCQRN